MDQEARKKTTPLVREYLRKHPDCDYEQLKKDLGIKGLSKPWFYVLRSEVRNGPRKVKAAPSRRDGKRDGLSESPSVLMTVEILESLDSSGFSPELVGYYKSHFFPVIKNLVPDGPALQMVFLADPPRIEIRRMVS